MSSTLGSGTRYHRVSEIKECENQAKFVNQRINEIEAFFGDLCSELVNYTRRTAKLRNNGDEISRIILDYSLKEKISRTTSEALHKVSEYLATVEDYRHTEVDRIVGKVVNPLAAYGEEIKHVRSNLKIESAARKKEIANMRKLERSSTVEASREAEIQLHNAMIDATKSANNLERCVLEFEGRRLKGLKKIITDFIQIEMLWHAKALETYSLAYNAIQLLHEEADLIEFRGTLLRSGSDLTLLKNANLLTSQQSIAASNGGGGGGGGDTASLMSSSTMQQNRNHRSHKSLTSRNNSMNSLKSGSRGSLGSLRGNNNNRKNRQSNRQQQQQQLHQSGLSHQNDDVTSLFTEGDDDVGVGHSIRSTTDNTKHVMNGLEDLEDDDDDFDEEDDEDEGDDDDDEQEEDDDDDDEDEEDDDDIDGSTTHSPTRSRTTNPPTTNTTINRPPGSAQHSPLKSALKSGISKP